MKTLIISNKPKKEEIVEVLEDVGMGGMSELIVYNDDHNTFQWVIECFVQVCNHSYEQAEQLSLIIHHKGKACVKIGDFKELRPLKNELSDRGLSAVINGVDQEK